MFSRLLRPVGQRVALYCGFASSSCRAFNSSAKNRPMAVRSRTDVIVKSSEDKRLYRGLQLENELKILLISDPTSEMAAAALDVNVGHMNDPEDLPGLAHFCEHMLFMGTEKFPTENEYQNYLTTHGGHSNAFTAADHTNYHFEVASPHLAGALDRFAPFFTCPLFNANATEREVHAVDSENANYQKVDPWRLYQLECSFAKPDHAYHKFGTGNLKTLFEEPTARGQDIRKELLKFHGQHYSSNLMALCVLGRETLEQLESMVVPLFAGVVNKKLDRFVWDNQPYAPETLGSRVNVVPIKDLRMLYLNFPTADFSPHYTANPVQLPTHLLGHEGVGSLLSELKRRGWASSLCSGGRVLARGMGAFNVEIELTEAGLDNVEAIVKLIFQAINLTRSQGIQEWIHRECEQLNNIEFRFKDKDKPFKVVTNLARELQNYPIEDVLYGPYRMDHFVPDLINQLMAHLVPDNMLLMVVSKDFQGKTNHKEKWYGVEYDVVKLDPSFLGDCKNGQPADCLKISAPNEFIPTQFDLRSCQQQLKVPRVLSSDEYNRLWYKKDDEFLLPKCVLQVKLRSPKIWTEPCQAVRAHMFAKMLTEALNEYAYNASLAGLRYSVEATQMDLNLYISGFNEKMPVLLEKIVDKMLTLEYDQVTFDWLKELYIRQLRNFDMEQPYKHCIYYASLLLAEKMWSTQEILNEALDISIGDLVKFREEIFAALHLECLVHGNASEEDATNMVNLMRTVIERHRKPKPLLQSQVPLFREIELPIAKPVVFEHVNKIHANSALVVLFQVGVQETRQNMLLQLFEQIISEPCFDQLRTKEQLGYIVSSGLHLAHGTQALRIIVQSDRSPVYVEGRVEEFLNTMLKDIENMSPEDFNQHKASLEAKRLDKPKKLTAAANIFWSEIRGRQFNFDRDNIEVAELRNITKEDLITFVKTYISAAANNRRKLSVRVFSTEQQQLARKKRSAPTDGIEKETKVRNIYDFKSNMPLYPRPKPFIEVSPIGVPSCEGIDAEE